MAYGFVQPLHIAAAVLCIIELGLTGYYVSVLYPYTPAPFNFDLFSAIWSLLVLAYVDLTPLYLSSIFHRLVSLGLEIVTAIFWFAGAIALAVFLHGTVNHCTDSGVCGPAQAAVAFAFILWALFMVLVVLDTLESLRSRRMGTGPKPSGPIMA